MVDHIDAKSQWIRDIVGGGLGFSDSETQYMKNTYTAVHALAPNGTNFGADWITNERKDARNAIIWGIANGDFAAAGYAIHKLGDTYAHSNDDGTPKTIPNGHAVESMTGRDPDDIYRRPTLTWDYAKDLSRTIALGMGATTGGVDKIVLSGMRQWRDMFLNSKNQDRFRANAENFLKGQTGLGEYYVQEYQSTNPALPSNILSKLTMGQHTQSTLERFQKQIGFQPYSSFSLRDFNWANLR